MRHRSFGMTWRTADGVAWASAFDAANKATSTTTTAAIGALIENTLAMIDCFFALRPQLLYFPRTQKVRYLWLNRQLRLECPGLWSFPSLSSRRQLSSSITRHHPYGCRPQWPSALGHQAFLPIQSHRPPLLSETFFFANLCFGNFQNKKIMKKKREIELYRERREREGGGGRREL